MATTYPKHHIKIWEPKYSTNSVLLAAYRVRTHNYIVFTKAKHLEGHEYYISGEDIRKSPLTTNGKIPTFEVDMDALKRIDKGAKDE